MLSFYFEVKLVETSGWQLPRIGFAGLEFGGHLPARLQQIQFDDKLPKIRVMS
jgi:hypothetical protein